MGPNRKQYLKDIGVDLKQVTHIYKNKFKTEVTTKVEELALNYVIKKKLKHKKLEGLKHLSLEMSECLEPNQQNIKVMETQLRF